MTSPALPTRSSAYRRETDDTTARILDAALASIAEYGVTKTTLEDIAREAGCSRATVYRYFPGKRALLDGIVDAEVRRLARSLDDAARSARTLEDVVVALLYRAGLEFADHAALRHVLAVEPELVLTHVVFDEGNRALAVGSTLVTPHLARFLPADAAVRAGEWLCRLAITYLFSPSEHVSFTDEDSVRRLVRTFVLPGLDVTVAAPTA